MDGQTLFSNNPIMGTATWLRRDGTRFEAKVVSWEDIEDLLAKDTEVTLDEIMAHFEGNGRGRHVYEPGHHLYPDLVELFRMVSEGEKPARFCSREEFSGILERYRFWARKAANDEMAAAMRYPAWADAI